MDSEIMEDLALARRVVNGDESALESLYGLYADPLYAFVSHALEGAQSEVEEVWQEALEAAVRTLPGYQGQSRLFSWLCSIARHKVADHWRRQSRRHVCLMPPENLVQLMDAGPLPDEIVNRRATCQRVGEILELLSPEHRAALVARYAEGQSVEDTARLLDKSYKATESVLSRARAAFRAALAARAEVEL